MAKPTLKYSSGWVIKFDKHGLGPMLFMKWIQNNQPNYKHPFDFRIRTIPNEDDVLNDVFEIRWKGASKELVTDCFEYIKGNI